MGGEKFDHRPCLNLPEMVGVGESIISGEAKAPLEFRVSKLG